MAKVYSAAFRRRLHWSLVSVACTPMQIDAVLKSFPQDPEETITVPAEEANLPPMLSFEALK